MEIPSWLKPVVIRKVRGIGMAPKLRPGQWVMATPLFRKLRPGQVVIVEKDHKELIKRIERIQDGKLFVIGDNLTASNDSRQLGWFDEEEVVARVLKPNLAK